MKIFLMLVVLVFVFYFFVYIPSVKLLKKKESKGKESELLLSFIAMSLLFLLINYLFSNYYLLNSTRKLTECSGMLQLSCLFTQNFNYEVAQTFRVYVMIFLQLILYFTYAYFTVYIVSRYKNKNINLPLLLFFLVSITCSLCYFALLYDVSFVGGLEYISLLLEHAYIVLPICYLLILIGVAFGQNQIQLKKRR